MKMLDRTGKRYGRLTVVSCAGRRKTKGGHTEVVWKCKCDCGNEITVTSQRLQNGTTKSCGCLRHELLLERNYTHRLSNTPLYRVWASIKDRCYRENTTGYKNYGGRGIGMCDEWKNSFENFNRWAMSNGYQNGLTIERIDNDGDYSPKNCKFIPRSLQSRNRRNCHYITYNGETKTLSEWCREYRMDRECIRNKEKKYGDGAKAIEETLKKRKTV